ncbi:MAG: ABC-2 type transport system permease protein [Planctomycetota bacterium]|jgi:ABC-2 type transport system permease protein
MMRLELLRLVRSRRPLLAIMSLALFLGLMLLGFYTYAKTETGGEAEFRYTFENASYFNGLTFALYAFYFGFLLVLPIFAATEGGAQLAGDTSSGALRLLLARPISRARLFASKVLIACISTTCLCAFLLTLALFIGLLAVGWGDLNLYPGVLQMTDHPQHLEQSVAIRRFAMIWPAASLAMLTPLSFALLISSWVKSPVNAVGTSVALYLVLYVIAEIHFFEALRPWLFTSHMAYWRELFREDPDWWQFGRDAAKLTGFTLVFLGLALRRFQRREET